MANAGDLPSLKDYQRLQDRIKAEPSRRNLASWILLEQGRLSRWNDRHGLLLRGWLPFMWTWNRRALESLGLQMETVILPQLQTPLRYFREHGWQWSTRTQYNLAAVLQRFVEAASAYPWKELPEKLNSGAPGIKALECHFLVLTQHSQALELLKAAFQTWIQQEPDRQAVLARTLKALTSLLSPKEKGGFGALIEGINSLRYRRLTLLEDLISGTGLVRVSPYEFDAPGEVQGQISAQILRLQKTLTPLLKDQDGDELLDQLLSSGGTRLFPELEQFYRGRNPPYRSWQEDREDVLVSGVRFLDRFMENFGTLMAGQVYFKDSSGKVSIWDRSTFFHEQDRLLSLHHRFVDHRFTCVSLSLRKWAGWRSGEFKLPDDELLAGESLVELGDVMAVFGRRLLGLVQVFRDGVYGGRTLHSTGFLEGKTLGEALMAAAKISLQWALWAQSPDLTTYLDQRSRHGEETAALKRNFERLADPVLVREFYDRMSKGQ